MAAVTAPALYPVEGVKVPAFNMGARDFFEALADALGYARSNIVELFRYLRKPEVMNELARSNDRLREALTGENCKFISDVISSAWLPLAPADEPDEDRGGDKGPPDGRACPGCEQPVSAIAQFCESCGGRL